MLNKTDLTELIQRFRVWRRKADYRLNSPKYTETDVPVLDVSYPEVHTSFSMRMHGDGLLYVWSHDASVLYQEQLFRYSGRFSTTRGEFATGADYKEHYSPDVRGTASVPTRTYAGVCQLMRNLVEDAIDQHPEWMRDSRSYWLGKMVRLMQQEVDEKQAIIDRTYREIEELTELQSMVMDLQDRLVLPTDSEEQE